MRAVLQRVDEARVEVAGEVLGAIERGFVVLVAAGEGDTPEDATYLAHKIIHLRVFEDEQGKMNRSLLQEGGALLVISQFTLYGDCRKGRRPSFVKAMPPQEAAPLIEHFITEVQEQGVAVQSGQFGAQMKVYLCNNGPVTLLLESRK